MEKHHISLTREDKQYLEHLLAKGSMKAGVSKRATALLELDRGKTLAAVSATLSVSYGTVLKWRNSYLQQGFCLLQDQARPVEIDGVQRAKVTALACSEPPKGHARWSLRLLADRAVELGYCQHLSYRYAADLLKKTSSSPT